MKHSTRPIAAITALALVIALLAGCSSTGSNAASSTDTATEAPKTPVSGGTFVYDTDVEPTNFDPQANVDMSNQVVSSNIFDSLVFHAEDGKYYPWLAESWTVSPDGLVYTFKLRQGVTFHNGEPFNAEAVKANFDRGNTNATSPTVFGNIGGRSSYRVVDDYTFEITQKAPNATTLDDLSFPGSAIIAPSQLTPEGLQALSAGGTALIGTGPFKVVSYTKGSTLVLARNDAYQWGPGNTDHPGPAYLDGIELNFVSEPGNRIGALTSGQVDAITQVPTSSINSLQNNEDLQLQVKDTAGLPYSLELNTLKGPFTDKNVRLAFRSGIDIDGLLNAVYNGQAKRAWTIVTDPTSPAGSADQSLVDSWAYDPEAAGELLDQSGWTELDSEGYRTKNGERLSVTWLVRAPNIRDQRDVLAQGIQAEAKKIGIEVVIDPVDNGTYFARLKENGYDLSDTSLTRADANIIWATLASIFVAANGGYNWANVTDQQIDDLLTQQRVATDDQVRVDAFHQVQQKVNTEAWFVPLNVLQYRIGSQSYVQDITFQAAGYPLFYDTWLDGKS